MILSQGILALSHQLSRFSSNNYQISLHPHRPSGVSTWTSPSRQYDRIAKYFCGQFFALTQLARRCMVSFIYKCGKQTIFLLISHTSLAVRAVVVANVTFLARMINSRLDFKHWSRLFFFIFFSIFSFLLSSSPRLQKQWKMFEFYFSTTRVSEWSCDVVTQSTWNWGLLLNIYWDLKTFL